MNFYDIKDTTGKKTPDDKNSANSEKNSDYSIKSFLKGVSAKYRLKIAGITLLSLLVSCFSLAFAYLTKYIVNSAAAGGKNTALFIAVAVSFLLVRIILKCVYNYSLEKTASKIFVDLRQKVFSAIINSDYAKVTSYHSGELINRLSSDVSEIAQDEVYIVPAITGLTVQLAGTAVLLFTIDYKFALLFLIGALIAAATVGLYRVKIKKYRKNTLEKEGASRSFMQDNIGSIATVKAFNAENNVLEKSKSLLGNLFNARLARAKLSALTGGIYSFIGNLGLIFSIIYFGAGIMRGADYGSATAVVLLLLNVQQPINGITSVISAFYTRSVSAERLIEVTSSISENANENDIKRVNEISVFEKLEVKNLYFSFGEKNVLSDVSFEIRGGEKVCFLGRSGEGKSTLIKLILGIYEPFGGEINACFNENGLEKEYGVKNIKGLFAYVPQGNFLIAGTIYENLTFFTGEANESEVKKAIEAACADFVYDLPCGLNTRLLERGGGLSEGQIQRLAIARALVSDRKFMLFDEATSALDEQTEKKIIENVCSMKDKTCIFISHRKAAEEITQKTFVIDNGKIFLKQD